MASFIFPYMQTSKHTLVFNGKELFICGMSYNLVGTVVLISSQDSAMSSLMSEVK